MRKLLLFSLILLLSFCLVSPVLAVGVKVRPQELNLAVNSLAEAQAQILVTNIGQQPAIYQVYPDKLNNQINLSPTDFLLEPGASQLVDVTVSAKLPGQLQDNISVVARPLAAGNLVAGSGVKLPVTLVVNSYFFRLGLLLALLIFIVVFFVVKLNKRPKFEFGPKL